MATTSVDSLTAITDGAGNVVALQFTGTCDACSDLRIEVVDPSSSDVLCAGPVTFVGIQWSKSFTSPEDFGPADFACDQTVNVALKCRDSSPATTLLDKSIDILCAACSITISSAQGIPGGTSGGDLQQLTIQGTATCASVEVNVSRGGSQAAHPSVPVTNGVWQATLIHGGRIDLKGFHCKDVVSVKAVCTDDPDCSAVAELTVECVSGPEPCPDTANVTVTGPNGFSRSNPTDAELECLPPGNYTIRCTDAVAAYEWRSNDLLVTGPSSSAHVVSLSGDTMVVSIANGDNRHFSVVAVVSVQCRPLRTIAFHCGGRVDCVVSEWSNWSKCNDGVQRRTRTVIIAPSGGGKPCPPLVETRACPPDAVDCEVSDWSPWSKCTGGQKARTRTVITQPSNGGRPCPALTDTQPCTDIVVDLCLLWLFINLGLTIVTAVLIFVAFCVIGADTWAAILALASGGTLSAVFATLSAVVIGLLIAAAVAAAVTLISWVLWIILCLFASLRDILCDVITFVLFVLHVLMALAGVIGLVLLIFAAFNQGTSLGCAAGAFVDVGWFGIVEQIFFWIGVFTGCIHPFGIFGNLAPARRAR